MEHTWASGAIELFRHAESHIDLNTAFDKRIAFISIDNCVEIAVRTYLSLPASKSGVAISRKEVEAVENSFPKLVQLLFEKVPDLIIGLDAYDIEHYHRIRNQLYHNGTGLSVDDRYLEAYRQIAQILLTNLFGVDVSKRPLEEASLSKLILLWNQIDFKIKSEFEKAGIDYGYTYKWEEAIKAGILNMDLIRRITELRTIRNTQAHSLEENIDGKQITYGIDLAKYILSRLSE